MNKGLMTYVRSSNILCIGKTETEKMKTSKDTEKRTSKENGFSETTTY